MRAKQEEMKKDFPYFDELEKIFECNHTISPEFEVTEITPPASIEENKTPVHVPESKKKRRKMAVDSGVLSIYKKNAQILEDFTTKTIDTQQVC